MSVSSYQSLHTLPANYRGTKLIKSYCVVLEESVVQRVKPASTSQKINLVYGCYVLARNTDGDILEESERPTHGFIDLKQTYDRVHREMFWKALEKEDVCIAYI